MVTTSTRTGDGVANTMDMQRCVECAVEEMSNQAKWICNAYFRQNQWPTAAITLAL